jgi:hypothetical protein
VFWRKRGRAEDERRAGVIAGMVRKWPGLETRKTSQNHEGESVLDCHKIKTRIRLKSKILQNQEPSRRENAPIYG